MAGQILPAVYVHASPYGTSSGALRVYVPEFMPAISQGNPKISPDSVNPSCSGNASDCKQAISAKMSTQNYVTAKPCGSYAHRYYSYGSTIFVKVMDDATREVQLVPTAGDNSWDPPED